MAVSINGNGTVTGLTDLGSSELTVDTNTLHVDSTNNRVGVGTLTPTTTLDVLGTVNATAFTGDGSALTGVGNETITLSGDVTGSGTTAITVTIADDSHNHVISNVDGLQTALDGKQPLDADLTAIGALAKTDGNFIVGNGTTWVAEAGATARSSLGLGSAATSNTGDFATAAQGTLADSAVQPGDNVSTLTNDSGYITGNQTITLSGDLSGSGTTSINAQLGSNVVNANELNVTGNGTTSQYLRSDGDGTFTWATPPDTTANQTITLSGDASGSGTTAITVTVADDSHNHVISNVDGLQTALDAKAPLAGPTFTGNITVNGDILVDEIRARSNQDLTISCGESFGSITDATYNDEIIRLAGEGGVKVYASSDNLTSGLNRETTLIDTSGNMSLAGTITPSGAGTLKDVTGNYGSIEIDGGATGGYEGYSIGGRAVFMHNNSTTTGIYNDVNNHWIMRGVHGGLTSLYYNGAEKLQTASGGVDITGTCTATSFSGSASGLTGIPEPDALSTASGSAPSYSARAWASFNGGTSPAAGTIQGSGNVSSVTDNATGQATINFATAMPNDDYAVVGMCTGYSNYNSTLMVMGSANGSGNQLPTTKTTSAIKVHFGHSNTVTNQHVGLLTIAVIG